MKRKTTRSSSSQRPRQKRNRPSGGLRAFARRAADGLLTLLSWSPARRFPFPLALALGAVPVLYMLIVPGGWFSGRRAIKAPSALSISAAASIRPRIRETGEVRGRHGAFEPDPFRGAFETMVDELDRTARAYPHRVAIYIKDLQRGWEWSYHADDLFPSASLIKVPIMAGVFAKIHKGELSLSSQLTLRRRVRMGGSGTIKWKRDGTKFTVRRLLEKLIFESDNTAMLILIDEIGMGYLQRFFPSVGLVYTEIYPDGLSLTGGRVRYENYTTAREMGGLFEKIYRHQVVDQFASELMIDILKRRPYKTRLAKKLPPGWEIAHKTGLLRRACHDVGIVFSPDGDYVIAVLTGRNRSYHKAKKFIEGIGKITYDYYKHENGLYAKRSGKKP